MTTVALAGYSTTRGLYKNIVALMGAYTIWEPPTAPWGYSSQFRDNIVPLINALDPDLIWVGVGGAWDFRRSPDPDSDFDISVSDYKINMTVALNSILSNTSTQYVVVANCVPIDRTTTQQSDPPAPYRFESDASLYRAALLDVLAAIGNDRLIFYDYNQLIIDRNISQPDGIHPDDDGDFLISNVLSLYFKNLIGDSMADKISLNDNDFIIAPYVYGQGNGTIDQNTGLFASYRGLHNCVLTNMDVNHGYKYQNLNSRIIFDAIDPDFVETDYVRSYTNTNEFTIEAWVGVGEENTNRNLCGARDGSNDFWRLALNTSNKLTFTVRSGGVNISTITTTTVSVGLHYIVLVKRANKFYFLLDGVLIEAYDEQDIYTLGNVALTDTMRIGSYGASQITWKDALYWFRVIKDSALSNETVLYNYNMGVGMNGLIGNATGNNMSLDYFYSVNFHAGANGSLIGDSTQAIINGGDSTAVTAVPDANYHFTSWTGDYTGTGNPLIITNITSDIDTTANFAIDTYAVNFHAGANGSLTGDTTQTVSHGGDSSAVTAVPDTGASFTTWSGDNTSTDNPLTVFNVTSDMDMTANFELNSYTVRFTVNDERFGSLVGDSSQIINYGGSSTAVRAEAYEGYDFSAWSGSNSSRTNPLTLTNVTGNMSVQANFVREFDNNQMLSGSRGVSITFDTDSTDFSPALFSTRGRIPFTWNFPE